MRLLAMGLAGFGLVLALMHGEYTSMASGAEIGVVSSPDGRLHVALESTADGELIWRLNRVGADGQLGALLPAARLAMLPGKCSLAPVRKGEDAYTALHGKRSQCGGSYHETTITCSGDAAQESTALEISLRVYNDGAAVRYCWAELPNTVEPAPLQWSIPAGAKVWQAPYDEPSQWTPAYERYYEDGVDARQMQPNENGWAFPALLELPGDQGWILLTQACVPRDYCATRMALDPRRRDGRTTFSVRFPDPGEGNGVGAVRPTGTVSPWYVVVADDLATIVRSTLVTDLNPACKLQDTSWVKPGRAAWSWWSDSDSPRSYEKQIAFIDLAAEMGWEYYLVDANWDLMDGGNVREMAEYASRKGVGLILWYNSGGSHNIVTEKPRGCMTQRPIRRFEMELLKSWGIKGIKVDFFQSDKQHMMDLYHGILEDAADFQLMVDFHGCTLPYGWSRTWPHLMTMEAVRGAECYKFDKLYPEMAPTQNTIIPFTRNAVGSMDYTPVAFSDSTYPHQTTNCHELALSVIFESGFQHMADKVSAYRDLPDAPKEFLKKVPAAWDDTLLLNGRPGDFVVLARRKGEVWCVAGINGRKNPLEIAMDYASLGLPPDGRATFITDGADARSFASSNERPERVNLMPCGGFVLRLEP